MPMEHKTTESEIKEIWERLTAGETRIESAHDKIENLEKLANSVHQLALSISQIASETKALREDYEKVDKRIVTLESKPAKRFESFMTAILTSLAAAIVGYILGKLNLNI